MIARPQDLATLWLGTGFRCLAAVVLVLAVAACDSGSSTDPGSQTVILQGEVVSEGSEWHPLVVTDPGVFHIEVVNLRAKLLDVTGGNTTLRIGVGLGRPEGGECNATFRSAATIGDRFPLGLVEAEYCVLLFDPGLPPDSIIEYTVSAGPE